MFQITSSRRPLVAIVGALTILAFQSPATARDTPEPVVLADALDAAVDAAAGLPRLHSLLVSWRGELVLERYFNGARATRPANIKSASKSVLSALIGSAIHRGLIESVDQPIVAYFPELLRDERQAAKRTITVEDLLTMRSGLETTSNRNYGAWVQSRNWVTHVLNRPLVTTPGSTVVYSTGNSHLLSAILTKASGTSTWQFARQALAEPLGIALPRWPQDPQGIYFGGNDMLLTPRDMVKFGELYLNRGQANGRQIVPSDWIESSFVPRGWSRVEDRLYGYGWWIRQLAGRQAYYAWGYGGQFIFIVPDLQIVVVTTSSVAVSDTRRDHRDRLYDVVERLVVDRLAAVAAQTAVARTRP